MWLPSNFMIQKDSQNFYGMCWFYPFLMFFRKNVYKKFSKLLQINRYSDSKTEILLSLSLNFGAINYEICIISISNDFIVWKTRNIHIIRRYNKYQWSIDRTVWWLLITTLWVRFREQDSLQFKETSLKPVRHSFWRNSLWS